MAGIRIALVVLTALMLLSQAGAQNPPATQPAKVQPVDYQKLKDLLPAQAVGIQRSTHEGENLAVGEMVMSKANADYTKPNSTDKDPQASIEIMDWGANPQMVMGLTAWRSVPIKIENDAGYQRTVKFKEFPAFQTYERAGEARQMMLLVAERFLVTLRTANVSEADFMKWAEALPWDKLAALK